MTFDQLVTEAPESGEINAQLNRSSAREALEIDVLDPTGDPSWDRLATSHPRFTFFHSSAWMRVLCKTYGHKPLALYCHRHGETKALLPLLEVASRFTGRRGVSLPFSDSCEPLYFGDFDPSILFEELRTLARERAWKHFEIRGRLAPNLPPRPSIAFHGHSLDLRSGAETLFEAFASPVRRAIRKAERSGLTVRFNASEEALREFYRLHIHTRRQHGLPPQPLSFFENIYDEVIKPGLGFLVLARSASHTVAAAVYFHMGRVAVYKFGASDARYQDLRPNNLVMWHAIQYLAQNGFETLHLGRTSRQNEGLRRFKLAWGAVEQPINYSRFDIRSNYWTTKTDTCVGIHNALFTRLPLILNRLIGTILYPHLD
jgi:CelD/BcsL family acetyltransferase involved in cellulose biosynthesis